MDQPRRLLERPERAFLLLATAFGLFFACVTPPHDPPDEVRHHTRVFLIAEGRFGLVGGAPGHQAFVPRSILSLHPPGHHYSEEQLRRGRIPRSMPLSGPHRVRELGEVFSRELAPADRVRARLATSYSPLVYVATAPAVALGRAIGLPVAGNLVLARIAGLALWIADISLAIRRAPAAKWSLAAVALLPMSVAQGASISADPVSQIVFFLFFAELLRSAGDGATHTSRQFWGLVGLSALIGLVKPGYAPLTLSAAVLLHKEVTASRLAWVALIVAPAPLITLAWAAVVQAAEQPAFVTGADSAAQARFILTHPLDFVAAVARSSWDAFPAWLEGLVGNLGHLDVEIPLAAAVSALLALLAASAVDAPPTPRRWQTWVLLGSFLGASIAIMAMAYLGWNQVGARRIHGVQGRYFLLMLPFALAGLPRLPVGYQPAVRVAIPWVMGTVLAVAAVEMVSRYYEL